MRVLLVEDSAAVAAFVEAVLRNEPDLELLPIARDGEAGAARARSERPDVVLMDLELPRVDGLEAIERIMVDSPVPIVVFSAALNVGGRNRAFEALQAGAVEVLAKPEGLGAPVVAEYRARLIRTLRLMAQTRVVRRRPRAARRAVEAPLAPESFAAFEVLTIGGSTGAPPLLFELLAAVRAPCGVPVVVAQHIMPGFERGLAAWLSRTGHEVCCVEGGEPLKKGRVHLAPADRSVAVRRGRLELVDGPGLTPSVDLLFRSAAESYGPRVAAFLLSGMGEDGAAGMFELFRRGAFTAAQSPESCTVASMPDAARRLGGVMATLSPVEMQRVLRGIGEASLLRAGGPAAG